MAKFSDDVKYIRVRPRENYLRSKMPSRQEVRDESGVYGALLSSFAARIPSDRSIAAMGYSSTGERETFSYVCDWNNIN
jgi:hypothetical protein